jgi:hypothetical protein
MNHGVFTSVAQAQEVAACYFCVLVPRLPLTPAIQAQLLNLHKEREQAWPCVALPSPFAVAGASAANCDDDSAAGV